MTDMNDSVSGTKRTTGITQYLIVGGLIVAAFFGAYRFATARSAQQSVTGAGAQGASGAQASVGAPAGGAPACACCSGSGAPTVDGVSGDPVEGAAEQAGGVQSITVEISGGVYSPNIIKLKAGVPAKITFGQSSGCTGQVVSQDLGFQEDLTAGPRTVELPSLKPGTYAFSCGMAMVFGKIVVE